MDKFVYRVVVLTLAAILLAMIIALLAGLFHQGVDNAEIFKILGPGFSTVVGAFVGILCSELRKKPD